MEGRPPVLEYSSQSGARPLGLLGLILTFLGFSASVGVAIYSFGQMNGDRLLWEGGYEYFLENFAFSSVLGLAGIGMIGGIIFAIKSRAYRGWMLLGILCNVLWAAWWARHLI